MFFAVNHNISDPGQFWSRAQESLPNLPDGIKVHGVYPNADMNEAVCIWEADSLEQITDYLEGKTGDVSNNTYLVINEGNAMGLPGS